MQYANRAKQIKIKPGTAQLLSQEVPWHEVRSRPVKSLLQSALALPDTLGFYPAD